MCQRSLAGMPSSPEPWACLRTTRATEARHYRGGGLNLNRQGRQERQERQRKAGRRFLVLCCDVLGVVGVLGGSIVFWRRDARERFTIQRSHRAVRRAQRARSERPGPAV